MDHARLVRAISAKAEARGKLLQFTMSGVRDPRFDAPGIVFCGAGFAQVWLVARRYIMENTDDAEDILTEEDVRTINELASQGPEVEVLLDSLISNWEQDADEIQFAEVRFKRYVPPTFFEY